jgi:predicted permease
MLDCFVDLSLQARQRRGALGELAVFVRTLLELPRSALQARRVVAWSAFGNAVSHKTFKTRKGGLAMDSWIQDTSVAVRALLRRPGFTALAVGSLAVGVGANTTMFSTVNAILWQPLPVTEPERLVRLYQQQGSYSSLSYPNFKDVREQTDVFSGMFQHGLETFGLTNDGASQIIYGEVVSASYFDVLGIRPSLGNFFSMAESDFASASPVVVLSHSLWQRSFGGLPDVIGQVIRLNNHPLTVVGVAPQGFEGTKFGLGMDAWVPTKIWGHLSGWGDWTEQRGTRRLHAVARLASDVTIERAERVLAAVSARLEREFPETNSQLTFTVLPERTLTPDAGNLPNLIGLLAIGASGLVLLVACANVASLLYARGLARRKEFSVRMALGAGRRRLIRQLLTESSLLAVLGGGVGIALSFWTTGFVYFFLPTLPYRFVIDAGPDWRVLGVASLVSVLALFVFGLTPALQASRSDVGLAMKSETAGSGMSARRVRMFDGVVVITVALSFVTLLFSALFSRSLSNVRQLNPGMATADRALAAFDVRLGGMERDSGLVFFDQLQERANVLPGVESAALISRMPLGDSHSSSRFFATDRSYEADDLGTTAWRASVGTNYFSTADIPLLAGRTFGPQDRADMPPVVVVNEALANGVWGEGDVVGRRLAFAATGGGSQFEVVGVIPTGRYYSVNESPRPAIFFPLEQAPVSEATIIVHAQSDVDPLGLMVSVRRVAAQIDPAVPMFDVRTVAAHLTGSVWMFRLGAGVGAGMGLLALALASAGLYGIMAFSVHQRIRELGIRVALGARANHVLMLVLRKGMVLVGIGVVAGTALSLGASGLLTGMLFGVRPTDPLTLCAVALGMFLVAAIATIIPAHAATKTDPVTVLRSE